MPGAPLQPRRQPRTRRAIVRVPQACESIHHPRQPAKVEMVAQGDRVEQAILRRPQTKGQDGLQAAVGLHRVVEQADSALATRSSMSRVTP